MIFPVIAEIRPYFGMSAVRRQREKAEFSLDVAKVETPRPLGTRLPSDWSLMIGCCGLQ